MKATSLDDISREWTERDIRLYVSKQLGDLPDIGDTEVQKMVRKADCLFEWARLACDCIKPNRAGATMKERYDERRETPGCNLLCDPGKHHPEIWESP